MKKLPILLLLAIMLAIALLFTGCLTVSHGDSTRTATTDTTPDSDFVYTITNSQVTITRYRGSNIDIVIPSTIEGVSVISIGDSAFDGCSRLMHITIPSTVTSIGNYAFSNCSNLTSITIPPGIISIGDNAFYFCTGLTSVTIPPGVTSIGDDAFENCSSLINITIPSSIISIGDGAFSGCFGLTGIAVESSNNNYMDIEGLLFNKSQTMLILYPINKGEISYVIPSTVTSIGNNAFDGCSRLIYIIIPSSVTSIGTGAFNDCGLTDITIPSSIIMIGESAFENCSGLTSVTVQATNPPTLGVGAFENTNSDLKISVPSDSVEKYKIAPNWSTYESNIVGYN